MDTGVLLSGRTTSGVSVPRGIPSSLLPFVATLLLGIRALRPLVLRWFVAGRHSLPYDREVTGFGSSVLTRRTPRLEPIDPNGGFVIRSLSRRSELLRTIAIVAGLLARYSP